MERLDWETLVDWKISTKLGGGGTNQEKEKMGGNMSAKVGGGVKGSEVGSPGGRRFFFV